MSCRCLSFRSLTCTERKQRSCWLQRLRREEAEALARLEADETLSPADTATLLACFVTVDQFVEAFDLRDPPRTWRRATKPRRRLPPGTKAAPSSPCARPSAWRQG